MDFETFKAQHATYVPNMTKKARIDLYQNLVDRYEAVLAENGESEYIRMSTRKEMYDFRYAIGRVYYKAEASHSNHAFERDTKLASFEHLVFELEARLQEAKTVLEVYGNALTPHMGVWYVSEKLQDGAYLLLADVLGGKVEGKTSEDPNLSLSWQNYAPDSKIVRDQEYTKQKAIGGAYVKIRFPDPASEARFKTVVVILDDIKTTAEREGFEEGLTLSSLLGSGEATLETFNERVNNRHKSLSQLRGV